MASTASVDLLGFKEVQEYFSEKRIKKAVAVGVSTAANQVHSALTKAIFNRYTANNDLNKQLVGAKPSGSSVKFGKSILSVGLTYRIKRSELSKFSYSASYGALNNGDGWVHTVEVVRGQRKVLRGKKGRGGFTPRVGSSKLSHGSPKRIFRGGAQMLERSGRKRTPLKVLYAPNTANMINRALEKDAGVKKVIDDFPNIVGKLIDA